MKPTKKYLTIKPETLKTLASSARPLVAGGGSFPYESKTHTMEN